jgi:DNA replication and repair protein RecF
MRDRRDMHLTNLTVENFRAYERARFEFPPGLTVVLGPNASGKTTLLEAINLLATTTSPRAPDVTQLIRRGETFAQATGTFERDEAEFAITVSLGEAARFGARKSVEVDGRELARSSEVIGRVQVALFWVGDLDVVKGPPAERRRFVNTAIGQLSRRHLDDLARYRRALRQRNEVLRAIAGGRPDGRQLAPWTRALVESGAAITADRWDYVASLAREAAPLHGQLGAEELEVLYRPAIGDGLEWDEDRLADAFVEALESRRDEELSRGTTLVGPHRDDIRLRVGEVDLRRYGSQGQQRTAALALTLAQARVARSRSETDPILLLDDCLSELDPDRAAALLDLTGEYCQMIVTSACCPEALRDRLSDAHVIETG